MTQFYKDTRLTHMSQMEAFLWTKFLEEHGNEYYNYKYDIHLKKPIKIPEGMPKEYAADAIHLSSLRIDATMETKNEIYVVEIRPDATASAIGNLILYRFLYKMEFQPTKTVKMMLITNLYSAAMELTTRAIEIPYIVY